MTNSLNMISGSYVAVCRGWGPFKCSFIRVYNNLGSWLLQRLSLYCQEKHPMVAINVWCCEVTTNLTVRGNLWVREWNIERKRGEAAHNSLYDKRWWQEGESDSQVVQELQFSLSWSSWVGFWEQFKATVAAFSPLAKLWEQLLPN